MASKSTVEHSAQKGHEQTAKQMDMKSEILEHLDGRVPLVGLGRFV